MKISAAMIVKNEESMLPRCLKSIRDWVDEIVIVDTGSTDNTIEIAKQFKARVFEHPWQNDFSLHRNQSINYSTGDWICIIDADEEFVSDMSRFRKRLKKLPKHIKALVVSVNEISDKKQSTAWLGLRFFKRNSGIHYKNAVHNKAVYKGACAATDIQMNHYGYSLEPDKMAAKRARTESLLLERLSKDDKDHAALYYLTQLKIGEKKYKEACEYGERFFYCVPVHPKDFQFYGVMYFFMAWSELHLNEGGKALAWAKKGLEFYSDDLDLNYITGRIGFQAAMDDVLKEHGEKYLSLLPAIRNRNKAIGDSFENPLEPDKWFNRTIYSADEAAEKDMRKFMEVLAE